MDTIHRLKNLITMPGGSYRRGAIMAVATALGVSWHTIQNALRGCDEKGKAWKLGADKTEKLSKLLDGGETFQALKPGRKSKSRATA